MIKIDFKKLSRDYIWFGWVYSGGTWFRVQNIDLQWVIEKRNNGRRVIALK